jgi:hypothetical protein
MRLLRSKPDAAKERTKVERRAALMDESQLVSWSTRCTYDLGQHLKSYTENPAQLGDLQYAEIAAESVLVLVRELKHRHDEVFG